MILKSLRFLVAWALLIPALARAEAPAAPAAPASAAAPAGAPPGGSAGPRASGAVQVWDDRVFNLDSPPPPSAGVSPGGRYMGDAPRRNSEQERQWKAACAQYRNDVRAYRRCFQDQEARNEAAVQESFRRVEQNQQGSRLRGGVRPPSPLDYETPARVPSSEATRELERAIDLDKDSD